MAPVDTDAVLELTVEQALERSLAAGSHWISETDTTAVAMAREAAEFYAELKDDPKTKPSDRLAAFKVMQAAFADLGFTPGERARLGLAEVTAQSKLEALRDRASVVDTDGAERTG